MVLGAKKSDVRYKYVFDVLYIALILNICMNKSIIIFEIKQIKVNTWKYRLHFKNH